MRKRTGRIRTQAVGLHSPCSPCILLCFSCLLACLQPPQGPLDGPQRTKSCARPHGAHGTLYPCLLLPKYFTESPSSHSPPQNRSQASSLTPTSHKATSRFPSGQRPESTTQWDGGQGLGMVLCALNPSTQQADLCECEANLVYTEGNQASHDFHQQTMLRNFLPDAYQTCNHLDIPSASNPDLPLVLAQTRSPLRTDTSDPNSSCSRLKAPSMSPNLLFSPLSS